jgi:hypothetical protein
MHGVRVARTIDAQAVAEFCANIEQTNKTNKTRQSIVGFENNDDVATQRTGNVAQIGGGATDLRRRHHDVYVVETKKKKKKKKKNGK